MFKDRENHALLKVLELQGPHKDYFSFSVDYSHRIVFEYVSKNEMALLKVGDHSVYERYE